MSGQFTRIEPKPGKVAGDFTMATGAPIRGDAIPRNIVGLPVDTISIGKRLRTINKETVDKLYDDISQHGLLQPIGVQQSKEGPARYVILYGAHRFLAFKRGWEQAKKLLDERTDKDPEAYRLAKMWQTIPAIVHDRDMPLDYGQLKEIAENLIRQNLTPNEQALHQTKYTHLVKKLKLVVPADENRSATQKSEAKQREPHDAAHVPTATEKATSDLGISSDTLQRSHKKVSDLAAAVARDKGWKAPVKITPETPPSDEVEHTLRLAEMGIADKVKAVEKGKDPRKVHPVQVQLDGEITVRIDITDPEQLLGWFRGKLDDAKKPLSMKYLRGLHAGLGKLIAEAKAPV
jgi:hypothetical protein